MASKIIRITMFKIPSEENRAKFLDLYKMLASTATKVLSPLLAYQFPSGLVSTLSSTQLPPK
jgi:hypothetical protein